MKKRFLFLFAIMLIAVFSYSKNVRLGPDDLPYYFGPVSEGGDTIGYKSDQDPFLFKSRILPGYFPTGGIKKGSSEVDQLVFLTLLNGNYFVIDKDYRGKEHGATLIPGDKVVLQDIDRNSIAIETVEKGDCLFSVISRMIETEALIKESSYQSKPVSVWNYSNVAENSAKQKNDPMAVKTAKASVSNIFVWLALALLAGRLILYLFPLLNKRGTA